MLDTIKSSIIDGYCYLTEGNGELFQEAFRATMKTIKDKGLYNEFCQVTLELISIEEVIEDFKGALNIEDEGLLYWVLSGFPLRYI